MKARHGGRGAELQLRLPWVLMCACAWASCAVVWIALSSWRGAVLPALARLLGSAPGADSQDSRFRNGEL